MSFFNAAANPEQDRDQAYWQELADLLGWRIQDFFLREYCYYYSGIPGFHVIRLWAAERDRIMERVKK